MWVGFDNMKLASDLHKSAFCKVVGMETVTAGMGVGEVETLIPAISPPPPSLAGRGSGEISGAVVGEKCGSEVLFVCFCFPKMKDTNYL